MATKETVKGFQDFLGEDALKRKKILEIIENEYRNYGFEPAETPLIEFEDFVRGDNPNDEAVRDVFKLKDRGDRELALRYEFTFQLKRIANKQKLPYKRYQIGYVFRDEPIKKGRSRQFIQCDADVIGSNLKDEAECLKMASNVFEKLKMPVTIYVNNRKLINEILVTEKVEEKIRDNVLREIDKLDKLPASEVAANLAKIGAERVLDIFMQKESYFEKYNFYKEVKALKEYCKSYGLNVEFRPFLMRGLSYYNGSVFEVWSKELNVSLCGGGSYLVEGVQSTGLGLGLEPIFLLAKVEAEGPALLIVSLDQDKKVIELAETLRKKNIRVQTLMDKSLGKSMEYANSKGIKKVLVIGKEEVKPKAILKVKNMKTGKTVTVTIKDLPKKI
ncbi:histidine--tRNA ligase [archaeon]|nr:histidine--tRNA ligase [archaeon]